MPAMSRERLAIRSEGRRHYGVQFRLAAVPHQFTRQQALRQTPGSSLQKPLHVNDAAPDQCPEDRPPSGARGPQQLRRYHPVIKATVHKADDDDYRCSQDCPRESWPFDAPDAMRKGSSIPPSQVSARLNLPLPVRPTIHARPQRRN